MTRDEFRKKVKILKGLGITQIEIAKKIKYSKSQVNRAYRKSWKGNCPHLIEAFGRAFK